ncbi:MAG TPA: hypothetical protein PKD31_21475, partial [Blastocatellia bacterium]|nr:hypothetical protein [Blastocatellia bacterium]
VGRPDADVDSLNPAFAVFQFLGGFAQEFSDWLHFAEQFADFVLFVLCENKIAIRITHGLAPLSDGKCGASGLNGIRAAIEKG